MKIIIFSLCLLLTPPLYAIENMLWKFSSGILIEPFAAQLLSGNMTNELSNQTPSTNDGELKYDLSGTRFGLRTAWMIGKLTLGLELTSASYDYSFTQPSGTVVPDADMDIYLYNAFIMYRGRKWVPWLGIVLDGSGEDATQNIELKNAGGIMAGLGYKLTNWFQVNLEFRSYSFKEYTSNGTTLALPTEDRGEFNANEFSVGVSIPIELFGSKK